MKSNSTQQEGRLRTKEEILEKHIGEFSQYDPIAQICNAMEEYHQQFQPLSVSELKQKFVEHLGLKPGEELNTTDAYAVEWVLKNIV